MGETPIIDAHQSACLKSGGASCRGGRDIYALARELERNVGLLRSACETVLEEVGGDYLGCKDTLRSAVKICSPATPGWETTRLIELLETLSRYPVATLYPDGPCIEREDMEEILDILG